MHTNKRQEHYSSLNNKMENYYLWRGYNEDSFKNDIFKKFPYTYHPYEYNLRFNKYPMTDYIY